MVARCKMQCKLTSKMRLSDPSELFEKAVELGLYRTWKSKPKEPLQVRSEVKSYTLTKLSLWSGARIFTSWLVQATVLRKLGSNSDMNYTLKPSWMQWQKDGLWRISHWKKLWSPYSSCRREWPTWRMNNSRSFIKSYWYLTRDKTLIKICASLKSIFRGMKKALPALRNLAPWRQTHNEPMFKNGSKEESWNNRRIGSMGCAIKIMQRIIVLRSSSFLD